MKFFGISTSSSSQSLLKSVIKIHPWLSWDVIWQELCHAVTLSVSSAKGLIRKVFLEIGNPNPREVTILKIIGGVGRLLVFQRTPWYDGLGDNPDGFVQNPSNHGNILEALITLALQLKSDLPLLLHFHSIALSLFPLQIPFDKPLQQPNISCH